jgi:type I restriction enzyme, R subunit
VTEDKVEQNALEILESLGWKIIYGPDIGPDGSSERRYRDVVLAARLQDAVHRLNTGVPVAAREEAIRKVVRSAEPSLILDNHQFHLLLVNGVDVEYRHSDGNVRTGKVRLFDFDDKARNEFVAINQLTVMQSDYHRRPDVVLYVNGLPLAVIELKDPTNAKADLRSAFNQLQTYKQEIPALFRHNELLIISDGLDAEVGTISANFERFTPWKTIEGEKEHKGVPMLEVLLRGAVAPERFLDIIRGFIVFEYDSEVQGGYIKKLAAYHQYWAVRRAVVSTHKAVQPDADHRVGVVWHTQGSGKSLSMVFYSGQLVLDPVLANPTIVIMTDRNDLDDQLFETFGNCQELLRQEPVQATSREHLMELLKVDSGGVIFTTNAKFFQNEGKKDYPLLSDRRNIIVMADEAHRSQYNFKDGYAKNVREALPNASFIGFTGTPVELNDRSTPAVFGNYIDVYDIEQAVDDGATVPILYESRLIQLDIQEGMRTKIDQEIDELLDAEELDKQDEYKVKNAQIEAIVGNKKRIETIASDIVEHFENRQSAIEGKGMIVVMSRRIAVALYDAVIAMRPEWHNEADDRGFIKIVMTGNASDPLEWQQHIRSKDRRKKLAAHMKREDSPMKLVIVCDMWLTGFDVPSMHTMYLDKPMKGHNLMQAIARVNRVYGDKPGGLVVDYLGVAAALRDALSTYTTSGGKGRPTLDQAEAVAQLLERYEILQSLFHGFEYKKYFNATTSRQLQIILDAQEFILAQEGGEKRLRQHVLELSTAFALAVPHKDALAIREDVAFFQVVRARLSKVGEKGKGDQDYNLAIRQIVDRAIAPAGVVDIFEAAGLDRPNLSILSEEFLAEVRGMERKNLAVEALNRLLNDEVRARFATNAVQQRKFSEMLEEALKRYKNNAIEAAKVIEELIEIARQMRESGKVAEEMGLSPDEAAFYDALAENGSAREVMGDDQLRLLAQVLVKRVRANTSVDWTIREAAQARLRVEVRRVLAEYHYPPDASKLAMSLILEQAALYGTIWSTLDAETK